MTHRWTQEMDNLCVELWRKPTSANEIANALAFKFGTKISRMSVIGRITRLKNKGIDLTRKPAVKKVVAPQLSTGFLFKDGCLWIDGVGDDRIQCCDPKVSGQPYCPTHFVMSKAGS